MGYATTLYMRTPVARKDLGLVVNDLYSTVFLSLPSTSLHIFRC